MLDTKIATTSWIRELEFRRTQLRMSRAAVAKRSGVSIATVVRILTGKERNPRISNIAAIAAALGLDFKITLNSEQSPHDFRKSQAETKAKKLVRMVQGNMALEAQAVDQAAVSAMVEQTVCELLAGSPRRLWE
jgi:transcriptional regulator with XRE-family HTH domain